MTSTLHYFQKVFFEEDFDLENVDDKALVLEQATD